jgi:hypothetical protein
MSMRFADYQKRADYNAHGLSGNAMFMLHPMGPNYIYLLLDTSDYIIGRQTNYYSKTCSVQYVVDITGTSKFWTSFFSERSDDLYSDDYYAPLNGPMTTMGIKQCFGDHFYALYKNEDSFAGEDDLSYLTVLAEIGLNDMPAIFFDLSLSVSASETKYREAWEFFPMTKREDKLIRARLGITKKITPALSVALDCSYENNRCNLDVEETRQGYASYIQNSVKASLGLKI